MRLLEMRGMPLALLIDLVHRNGGVLGPAASMRRKVHELHFMREDTSHLRLLNDSILLRHSIVVNRRILMLVP